MGREGELTGPLASLSRGAPSPGWQLPSREKDRKLEKAIQRMSGLGWGRRGIPALSRGEEGPLQSQGHRGTAGDTPQGREPGVGHRAGRTPKQTLPEVFHVNL